MLLGIPKGLSHQDCPASHGCGSTPMPPSHAMYQDVPPLPQRMLDEGEELCEGFVTPIRRGHIELANQRVGQVDALPRALTFP